MIAVRLRPRRNARRADAIGRATAGARYLGGGTNLVDLMRENIEQPDALVDVTGPLARRSTIAQRRQPADRRGRAQHRASPPHPRGPRALSRCWPARSWPAPRHRSATWRRSAATSCSGRAASISTTTPRAATSATPGAGCDALEGFNRIHAILGASAACVATHPSDMCVALGGARCRSCICRAQRANANAEAGRASTGCPATGRISRPMLEPGELITAVEIPPLPLRRDARPIARCATGRATPSRWSRSPRRSTSTDGHGARRAPGAGRRRAQALARATGRGGAARRPGDRGELPRGRRGRARGAAHGCATTLSRSNSRSA